MPFGVSQNVKCRLRGFGLSGWVRDRQLVRELVNISPKKGTFSQPTYMGVSKNRGGKPPKMDGF